jgi:hypothetical protein
MRLVRLVNSLPYVLRYVLERLGYRIGAHREIEASEIRAIFAEIRRLTTETYGASEKELTQPARQRKWVRARSMLVYLGREWGD